MFGLVSPGFVVLLMSFRHFFKRHVCSFCLLKDRVCCRVIDCYVFNVLIWLLLFNKKLNLKSLNLNKKCTT